GVPRRAAGMDRRAARARRPRLPKESVVSVVIPVSMRRAMLLGAVLALGLAACDGAPPPSVLPPPGEVQAESTGHYCGMLLLDHEGPKGQIHLAGRDKPLWFSSVRDTLA